MAIEDSFSNILKPNFGNNPATFFKEAVAELKKVMWPSRPELIKLTLVVIGVSVGAGLYLGGLDFAFTKLIEAVLTKK